MSGVEQSIEDLVRRIVREELERLGHAATPRRYITVALYAAARSISESTVRQAIARGALPTKRIGRAVRVDADAEIAPRERSTSATERALTRLGLRGDAR